MQKTDDYCATIVSVVPFEISEEKPGVYPGLFIIPPCTGEPQLLIVGESVHYIEVDPDRSVQVDDAPNKMARSIVEDYITSSLQSDAEAHPGIFWKPGRWSVAEVETRFSTELANAKQAQENWFIRLVKLADDDWEKTRQHGLISDLERYAAKALGLQRPWLVKSLAAAVCPACGTSIQSGIVVCPTCKCVLDKEKYAALSFAG